MEQIGETAASVISGAVITSLATTGVAVVAGLATGVGVTFGLPVLAVGIVVGAGISYFVQDEFNEYLEGYWDKYFADFVKERLENATTIVD